MEQLETMRIFLRVAELASFTRAAESLGLPKANVSQAVRQLEELTGVRLLQRTTRKVSLTQDGLAFRERCRDLVADHDEVVGMFKSGRDLMGRLRVDLPSRLAHGLVIPRLGEFLGAHPRLELEVSCTDRRVDVISEGFDCVVRVGSVGDPSLHVRQVGAMSVANCASPAYLARFGRPLGLDDLSAHRLIHYAPVLGARPFGFEYRDGQAYRTLAMDGALTVNSSDAYLAACLAGLGLIQVPRAGVLTHLEEGTLVEVVPHLEAEPMPLSLLYPHRRHASPRLKAFTDWLEGLLREYMLC